MFDGLDVSEQFKNKIETAVKSGRLSHALILEGGNAETRLKAAAEIAKATVCLSDKDKPCSVCAGCKKADSKSHPDIHYVFKDDSSSGIKVDRIRQLKHEATLVPNDCDKSVFIIHEAQYMNPQAQNALLKVFEEPAPYVTFILTCKSKSALLETILSRATDYSVSAEEKSDDRELLEEAYTFAEELIYSLCKKTEFDFLCQTAVFQKEKQKLPDVISALYMIFADALAYKNGVRNSIHEREEQSVKLLSASFTEKKLLEYINATNDLMDNLNSSANANLLLTRLCSVFYDIKLKQ
ncbi:MAG: DNA polymerase III subunit delta' C-terminal domain-containing protein [Acutalibacteraceae bacterium]